MSKLKELIRELCPDGVEYKTLGEIAKIIRGASPRPIKNFITNDPDGVNWIKIGDVLPNSKYITVTQERITAAGAKKSRYVKAGDFILSNSMSFGRPYILKIDGCIHDGWLSISGFESDAISDYLYYVLTSSVIQSEMAQRASFGGAVQNLNADIVRAISIPVPPLPVQSEIVRILDNFTDLTAELTAELTARKKQYEFYRDKLLNFGDVRGGATSDVVWRTLGEVCNLQSGKAISAYLISDTQTAENPIPCYGANGLRGYVSTSNESGDKAIVGRQGALCGNVCFATGTYYATEHAVVVTDKGFFNSRFLYHLLVNADLNQYKTAGAQPGLSVARLNKVKVPVPTRTVQDRIASVLDNFDAICSDLKIGLPAEIEARQKQYEFYRDALLTYAATGKTILTDRQTDKYNGLIRLCQYVFGYVSVTLNMISENHDSKRKPITSSNREAGEYPYYGASGIVDYVSGYIFDGDYLLVSEDGNNLVARSTPIAFSISGKNWINNHAHVLKFDCYATRRYVEFYLNSIDLSQFISGGAQPKLNQKNLNTIPIPLPAIKEQERIVGILDRFDALCNDLTSGLPAEIEARTKQYEYYRDKLLSFQQK